MKNICLCLTFAAIVFMSLFSCRPDRQDIVKNPSGRDTTRIVDSTNQGANIICTDCNWQFELDGVYYRGTIDTCFYTIRNMAGIDTIIYCTGTSNDKKANVYFRLSLNRRTRPGPINSSAYYGLMVFDTMSTNIFKAGNLTMVNIRFQIDSFNLNRMIVSLDGTIYDGNIHQLRNGRFTGEFGKGTKEPKFFTFLGDTSKVEGYWNEASFQSNSLILEGLPYGGDADQRFKMIINTGASIRPGVYDSRQEQGLLSVFFPSLYFFYICESPGSGHIKVTIDSVNGNIVKARYDGLLWNGRPVSGNFQCRVKNYRPYTDSINKWNYIDENIASFHSAIYGGNILNATRIFLGSQYRPYKLIINGESDQLFSKFKIALSSTAPIDTGTYTTTFNPQSDNKIVDTLYFKSPVKTVMNHSMDNPQKVFIHIDSINPVRIVGRYYQELVVTQIFRQGRFRASF